MDTDAADNDSVTNALGELVKEQIEHNESGAGDSGHAKNDAMDVKQTEDTHTQTQNQETVSTICSAANALSLPIIKGHQSRIGVSS